MNRKRDQPYNSKISKDRLGILFGETIPESSGAESVPLGQINLSKHQPRRYFDPDAMQELIQSIQKHGILQPLLVRPMGKRSYELVAGERRYRAAKEAGLSEVPVVIREMSLEEAAQLTLIENLQREDLNPVEETEGILQLLVLQLNKTVEEVTSLLYRIRNQAKNDSSYNVIADSEGKIVQQVFDALGKMTWDSFIINRLPLLKLPEEILEALQTGKISYTKATVITRVKDEAVRQKLLDEAIQHNLSLSQIKERVKAPHQSSPVENDIPERMKRAYHTVKKTKIWKNPEKRKRLEDLLAKLEALMQEE